MKSLLLPLIAAVVLCPFAWANQEPIIGGPCEGCENVFVGLPEQLDSVSRIAALDEPGQPLVVEGTVKTLEGTPAAGIIVYAYHTNAEGVYPKAQTRHGALRGWVKTDEMGHYRFETIRPGGYPTSSIPQHIHMHIIEPGRGTYYIDDILFEDDTRLTQVHHEQMRRGRGGDGFCQPTRDPDGTWRVERDIILGKNIPGY